MQLVPGFTSFSSRGWQQPLSVRRFIVSDVEDAVRLADIDSMQDWPKGLALIGSFSPVPVTPAASSRRGSAL